MLFDAIVKGVIFLIFLFDSLLLKYRNNKFLYISFVSCTLPNDELYSFFGGVFRIFDV